ncbi:lipopolysaccharide transport system ATP-binding protein [Rhodopirellula rubra]|uniref:Lipopolysaccharide transport system ATP-binding protein n=1 Tax=Aporhodopirellula rubra TaxID=980271 RepID=A0A7W5DXB6_9BACT|nr:polysaccharide ABC transporter ATP-binding protein [Aporhodopirellula rubra]MBB3206264.1 lipopolysaccharide transport system ATP-binding protein [Aporhodopirellula rubra]
MSDNEVLIRCENVGKKFCRDLKSSLWYAVKDSARDLVGVNRDNSNPELRPYEFWANRDINFELRRGDCLGLVGRNGAGKTTLLKMLNGLIKPDTGSIEMSGRVAAMIALGAGFNPVLTARENVYINGSILGLSKKQTDDRFDEIIDFSNLHKFVDAPVRTFSSGMYVRLGFSIAAVMFKPDVLLLDEVIAVGDRDFRIKCMERVSQMLTTSAVIFVSHQSSLVARVCTQAVLMENGTPKFFGSPRDVISKYEDTSTELSTQFTTIETLDTPSCKLDAHELPFGGSLRLSIALDSKTHFSGLILRVHIVDSSGESIAEWDSRNHDYPIDISVGSNEFDVVLSDLRLSFGEYYISFSINDADEVRYLVTGAKCCRFSSLAKHYGVCKVQL